MFAGTRFAFFVRNHMGSLAFGKEKVEVNYEPATSTRQYPFKFPI